MFDHIILCFVWPNYDFIAHNVVWRKLIIGSPAMVYHRRFQYNYGCIWYEKSTITSFWIEWIMLQSNSQWIQVKPLTVSVVFIVTVDWLLCEMLLGGNDNVLSEKRWQHAFSQTERCHSCLATSVILPCNEINQPWPRTRELTPFNAQPESAAIQEAKELTALSDIAVMIFINH